MKEQFERWSPPYKMVQLEGRLGTRVYAVSTIKDGRWPDIGIMMSAGNVHVYGRPVNAHSGDETVLALQLLQGGYRELHGRILEQESPFYVPRRLVLEGWDEMLQVVQINRIVEGNRKKFRLLLEHMV